MTLPGYDKSRHAQIIRKQEALALTMLEKADKTDITIDIQLDVFDKVGRWVAIKNKLEDEGAGGINDFKRRITGETDSDRRSAKRNRAPGATPESRPRLEALKGRLPTAGAGGADGNSRDPGGEGSAAA